MNLAMDGNYREQRWFTPWAKTRYVTNYKILENLCFLNRETEEFLLPNIISDVTGQVCEIYALCWFIIDC